MTFERAFLLSCGRSVEGGISDVPHDRGGLTNEGVTQRRYTAWRLAHKQEDQSVVLMTQDEKRALALGDADDRGFWLGAYCADLPENAGCFHFDTAWQHGPVNAIHMLQQAMGGIHIDGVFGNQTRARVRQFTDLELLNLYFPVRKAFYDQILAGDPTQEKFYKGWMNRIRNLKAALE